MQMTPKIHPMLLQFNNQIQKEKAELQTENKLEENNAHQEDILTDIISTMEGQNDERHLNSEFLKFIKRMKTGEIKPNEKENNIIEDNRDQLEYNQGKPHPDEMEEVWNNVEN